MISGLGTIRGVRVHLPAIRATARPFLSLADRLWLGSLRMRGFRSQRLRTSAGWTHTLVAGGRGTLPPVVVLHGLSAAGFQYSPLLRRLRPHVRRLVAPDLLGHGLSDPPTRGLHDGGLSDALMETLDHFIDEPAVIFGNSMGGLAAVRYALERPERVRALMLCCPAGAPMNRAELDDFLRQFQIDRPRHAYDFVDNVFADRSILRPLLAWGVMAQFANPVLRELLASISPEHMLTPRDLGQLEMPVHLLWGGRDGVLWDEHLDFFLDHLPPHACVEKLAQFGHAPFLDRPDELAASMTGFLERVAGRRSTNRYSAAMMSASISAGVAFGA